MTEDTYSMVYTIKVECFICRKHKANIFFKTLELKDDMLQLFNKLGIFSLCLDCIRSHANEIKKPDSTIIDK